MDWYTRMCQSLDDLPALIELKDLYALKKINKREYENLLNDEKTRAYSKSSY